MSETNVAWGGKRKGDWMQTRSGAMYWPVDPRPEDVDINDIAHALSMLCRFGGHTARFYSVAEHSVHVSNTVPPEYALQGLMHDATEAYVIDVPRPLKSWLSNYEEIEADNWTAIAMRFNIPFKLHPSVKRADNTVLLAERNVLLETPPMPWEWAVGLTPAPVKIECWDPVTAKRKFLERFTELI